MKKKITSIGLQLLIWWILIWISMLYLSKHPAEKIGIFSSIDFIYQKISGISKIFNWRSQWDMNDLTQFKNSFHELKQVAASKACEKAVQTKQLSQENIDSVIQSLESVNAADFNSNKSKYIAIFTRINEEIQKYCK